MNLRDLFGNGDDRPPAPEMATAEDVEEYNLKWIQSNPRAADDDDGDRDPDLFSKELGEDYQTRAQFPWLFEPEKGVRWDFDPVSLRNLSQTNTWVGMMVQSITKEIAETPWTITRRDGPFSEQRKRLQTHPDSRDPIAKADTVAGELPDATAEEIARLLHSPNPDHDWHDFVEMSLGDLLEIGSVAATKAFPNRAYSGSGRDMEFVADPERVTPKAIQSTAPEVWTKDYRGKTGLLDGFWQFDRERSPGTGESTGGTTGSRGFRTPIAFDTAEVMWSDMTPRTNRRYGLPPTLIVRDFLQSIDLAVSQEQQYMSRGSVPSGAIVFEGYDREQLKEWKTENEENVKGKPWKMLTIAGMDEGVSFEPFSYNFQEMQFTERQRWYARVIASVFQVPTAVVGIEPEKVNYNTFQGERENFEENTLGPYLMKLERFINDQLIRPHWGDRYHFEFKPGVSESTRAMISERVRAEWNANLIQRSTALQDLGRDLPDTAADGYKDEVVEGSDDGGPFGDVEGLELSAKDADEPLRETDDWYQFDVQPHMIEGLQADIADDVRALFDEVLSNEEIQDVIERLAADETEKSLGELSRRLRRLLEDLNIADDIAEAIRGHSADAVRETLEENVSEAGADVDVDVEAVTARLRDRDIGFADRYADELAGQIRDTVGEGWAEGKGSREIAEDIAEQADIEEGWLGAERIARQELHVATGEARSAVADELGKVEVWLVAGGSEGQNPDDGDGRVREAHAQMNSLWKRPGESWEVTYPERGVQKESTPGGSEPGIGCRCTTLLRDIDEVDDSMHAGV